MEIISTRTSERTLTFSHALLRPISPDGGFYIPKDPINLQPILRSIPSDASFEEMIGIVTARFLADEFSENETMEIARNAFKNCTPILRKIDTSLYLLEMFHGPTGSHRDFGYAWLAAIMALVLQKRAEQALLLGIGTEKNGMSLAHAFGRAKNIKMFILYPAGCVKPLPPRLLAENGGNIRQLEVAGNIADIENLVRDVFADTQLTERLNISLANTINIARLLAQCFFFVFTFMRLRGKTTRPHSYAIPSGNYGTLTAGLYAWKCCVSAHAFFTDATKNLQCDRDGFCMCEPGSEKTRHTADAVSPLNLERLQNVFKISPTMMRTLIFPTPISEAETISTTKSCYKKYGLYFDKQTALAYASALNNHYFKKDSNLVIFQKDHPHFDTPYFEAAGLDDPVKPKKMDETAKLATTIYHAANKTDLVSIMESVRR